MDVYRTYLKKCEMLGTKMFEFKVLSEDDICITKYIENNEPYRIVKIPDFVSSTGDYAFGEVKQNIQIVADNLKRIKLSGYRGEYIDVKNIDTCKIKSMNNMFSSNLYLKEIDLSDFNTSKVEETIAMFKDCVSLEELDLSSFDTGQVKNMTNMFYGCNNLREIKLNNFDTRRVTDMSFMFYECESIGELDLSSFDTSRVTDMTGMFGMCSNMYKLDISSFNVKGIKKPLRRMFGGCTNLKLIITNKQTKRWLEKHREETALDPKCDIVVR